MREEKKEREILIKKIRTPAKVAYVPR